MVVSVLLMGPALGQSAQAMETTGAKPPAPADHRKTTHVRQARQHGVQSARLRRHVVHASSGHTAAPRTAAFLDDGADPRAGRQNGIVSQTGIASWYGGQRWHGKRTSSGTPFDQNALTAAHASLPLGSRVRVTLVDSGRDVVVTINDRPGTRRRVIDLSRAAAAELGILDRGIAMVTLNPL